MTTTTWRQKLAAVLEWSPVDQGQLPLLLLVPILGQYMLWCVAVLGRADSARFVNVPALEQLLALTGGFVAGGIALMLLGLVLRRRQPGARWFQHLAVQYYAAVLLYMGSSPSSAPASCSWGRRSSASS